MAISRHSPEWKRVIFMAMAGGVTFFQSINKYGLRHTAYQKPTWYACLPDENATMLQAFSKYDAARNAVHMMAEKEFLPDAAKERAARNAATELRSS